MTLLTIDELRETILSSLVLTAVAKAFDRHNAVANVAQMLRHNFDSKARLADLFIVVCEIRQEDQLP